MNAATLQRPPATQPRAPQPARPVRLEVSRQGVWHAVALFDLNDVVAVHHMTTGVQALAALDAHTGFRVVAMADVRFTVMTYSAAEGWCEGDDE